MEERWWVVEGLSGRKDSAWVLMAWTEWGRKDRTKKRSGEIEISKVEWFATSS